MSRSPSASTIQPKGPRGQLAVIEPRSAIELRDKRRQLDAEPPLVRTPARGQNVVPPAAPPARDKASDGLDDQHAIPAAVPLEEA